MLQDFGVDMRTPVRVCSDASAAIGIAQRRGMGKIRHIETNQLWLQEKVACGSVEIEKISTDDNLADHLTKPLPEYRIARHMRGTHQKAAMGRHPMMPKVAA